MFVEVGGFEGDRAPPVFAGDDRAGAVDIGLR
jgi:hypothetical protein